MLINLSGIPDSNGKIQFNVPRLTFDRRFNYKIGISHLNFEATLVTKLKYHELLCINTNVIDLSVQNPTQTLLHFPHDGRKATQDIRPPIVLYQTIQLYEFENASFELRRFHSNEPIELNHIFLQLEIIRLDAYGRLQ